MLHVSPCGSQDEKVFAIANSGTTNIELAMRKAWALQVEANNFDQLSLCRVDVQAKLRRTGNWSLLN